MSASQLDVLRDKLHAKSDGELRVQIEERLEPLRRLTRNTPTFTVAAGEYAAGQMINKLSELAFDERRDMARGKIIDTFLARVATMENRK